MTAPRSQDALTVGLAQITPVWLDREATLKKMVEIVAEAGAKHCKLVVFGEAVLPGYPFWVERTDGARFNSKVQKEIHAHYLDQAVQIEAGHLGPLCAAAAGHGVTVVAGCIERPQDRGGHTLYACLVTIDGEGVIQSAHRKLMPTYEERLVWGPGDGNGLCTHPVGPFTMGGLNCWENWMPLARSALYAQGEDLHVAVWPGSVRNTRDITRFIAQESRSFVISVSGLMGPGDVPETFPHRDLLAADGGAWADGGSCVAAPDGTWVVEPVADKETLLVATLDHARVREERQNFDPSGHYSRPDVLQLVLSRERQSVLDEI